MLNLTYDKIVRDDLPIAERFNDAAFKHYVKAARVMVEIYEDRVDIVSPGGVCKGITRENFGTVTITRNPIVAGMLFRIDYIEQMGTGIGRMRGAAREAGVAEPEFEFFGFFRVTFRRNGVALSVEASDRRAIESDKQAIGSDKQAIGSDGLSTVINSKKPPLAVSFDRKHAIVAFLEEHGRAKAVDFVDVIGLSKVRVRAILQQMASDGVIEKVGDKRYAYYVPKS